MNQEIKTEWLSRLKSGDYVQGTGHLCKNGNHCCLGVLAEIAVEQGLITKVARSSFELGSYYWFDGNSNAPTKRVLEWAGVSIYHAQHLANENDDYSDGKYTAVIPLIEAL